MTQPNQSELDPQWDTIIQEMIDWNAGTITKGYDREEEAECLETDTREYVQKLADYITANYTPNSEVADKVKTAVATRELELDHQWSKELERKVAEREHALWAITYDFLHNRDRNLCEEWEGLTKGGDK